MIEIFTNPENLVALAALAGLEIILGIDNVVFIAILVAKLPEHQQKTAYRTGLFGALITRVLLLLALSWLMGLTKPLFSLLGHEFTGRNLILFAGGLFLIGKSAHEIYDKVEADAEETTASGTGQFISIIIQVMIMDIIFSLDSVITAIGMVDDIKIMITAIILAMIVMLIFAQSIGDFVNRHPSMKILALAFLLLIGVLLTAEGLGQHIAKGYIYFAMGFALSVELVNMRFRKNKGKPSISVNE
ncbi:MAG: TerC family protein [Myxococcota bacterium]|nr:TerC family protein [Myxococcota bacterium]